MFVWSFGVLAAGMDICAFEGPSADFAFEGVYFVALYPYSTATFLKVQQSKGTPRRGESMGWPRYGTGQWRDHKAAHHRFKGLLSDILPFCNQHIVRLYPLHT